MPAKAPVSHEAVATQLLRLGRGICARRKALGVRAGVAAEAAGLSRVTLHRIEQGEASVTMGAYLNVMAALGLELDVAVPQRGPALVDRASSGLAVPSSIRVADYPQLKRLAWHAPGVSEFTPAEALSLYERNWRHLDTTGMQANERELLSALVKEQGKGHLLV